MTRQFSDERRKQQIRVAAIRCFVRRGYEATRLIDIARDAELSKGGVYFHYRTKEALFQDILSTQLRSLESRWSFKPVADQPPDRTLQRLVVAHLRTLEDEPDETRLGHLLLGMVPQDPTFREKLEESYRVMRALYSGVVARGIRDAVFTGGEVEDLTNCVLAVVQGLASQAALDPAGKLPVRPEDAAELVLSMLNTKPTPAVAAHDRVSEAAVPLQS